MTISGSNFNGAYAVEFGGVSTSFIVDSADTITASSPAEPAGAVNVTVSTPWGVSALSGADQFTYTSPPPPPGFRRRSSKVLRGGGGPKLEAGKPPAPPPALPPPL